MIAKNRDRALIDLGYRCFGIEEGTRIKEGYKPYYCSKCPETRGLPYVEINLIRVYYRGDK